jgi:A/G-specific adenine glycosylase
LQTFIQCYQNNFDIAIEPLEESKHIFSHIEWHIKGYHIKLIQKKESAKVEDAKAQINELLVYSGATKQQDLTWIQAKQLKDYALPSAFDAYRGYIQ